MEQIDYLTARELQILDLIRLGNTSLDISKTLHITKNTVDTHRRNILKKTKSKSVFLLINSLNE
jgi:DNA-binding CsgD family transcriptional regulator